jgi:hypothetical protein
VQRRDVNYTGNGSGAGFTSFVQKQADIAGSDYAMSSTQAGQVKSEGRCGSGDAVDIPAVTGAVAVIFNVPGASTLDLSAKNLSAIFDGTITNWDNAAIKADNPGVTLPNLTIQPFYRSDTSGTSYNFSNYLNALGGFAAANKQWPGKAGQGAKGSSAVAAKVKSTSGRHRLRRVLLRDPGQPELREGLQRGRHLRPADPGQRGQLHREGQGRADRRGHQAHLRLHRHERHRLPGRPGDLRDRLRQRQQLEPAPAHQGLPELPGLVLGAAELHLARLRAAAGVARDDRHLGHQLPVLIAVESR